MMFRLLIEAILDILAVGFVSTFVAILIVAILENLQRNKND